MTHVTISIPDKLYAEMKHRPEIKWSEIVRMSISAYLRQTSKRTTSKELFGSLSADARQKIISLNEHKTKKLYDKMVKEEWKESQFSTRV